MQTISVNVMNLCVPCACRCRHCLLAWDGRVTGAEDARAQAYARSFRDWLGEKRPELSFLYGFGYAMEHPHLMAAIEFCREMGSPTAEFLQLNGMRMRTAPELVALLTEAKAHGVRLIDLTFYGTEAAHDAFAGRKGDFRLLMDTLRAAQEAGLSAAVDMPLTAENAHLALPLLEAVASFAPASTRLYVPHSEGRGQSLATVRLTGRCLSQLPEEVRRRVNRQTFRTEAEWLRTDFPAPTRRVITLTLTAASIARWEQTPFDETIACLEALDDAYYAALPPLPELAARYGDPAGDGLYSLRDLAMTWERRFIADHRLSLHDIHDERGCFARRL